MWYLATDFNQNRCVDYRIKRDRFSYLHDPSANGLHVNASAGGNMMQQSYDMLAASVVGLDYPGVYKLANGVSNRTCRLSSKRKH